LIVNLIYFLGELGYLTYPVDQHSFRTANSC